jgi:hypothetical protein
VNGVDQALLSAISTTDSPLNILYSSIPTRSFEILVRRASCTSDLASQSTYQNASRPSATLQNGLHLGLNCQRKATSEADETEDTQWVILKRLQRGQRRSSNAALEILQAVRCPVFH